MPKLQNSKETSLLRNEYVFSIVTKIITIIVGLIQSILVARYLGAELKGMNAYIQSIASIGAIVITFGMHQAYPFFRKKHGKDAIYRDFFTIFVLLYVMYFVIAIFIACLAELSLEVKAIIVLIPLLGYSRVVAYVALIEFPNRRNAWWLIVTLLEVVYTIFLWVFIERSALWAISILAFGDLARSIVYTRILRIKPRLHKGLVGFLGKMARFGFFPMVALLMTTLNYRIDVIMLHEYEFVTDAMIGIYSLGIALADKIVMIPDTLKGVLASKLAKGAPPSEVAKVSRIGFWSSFCICALVALFGRWIIDLLYGTEFSDSYYVVVITAIGMLAVSYFKQIAQYNIVNGKQKLNVAMLSIAVIVDVVFNLLLIPIWGINGAAVATSIGNTVCGVVFVIYFCSRAKVPLSEMIVIQRSDIRFVKKYLDKNVMKRGGD